ncbi:M48 family metalloprotease [Myxacorys almedinensis]|uniref:M48 family metalloprotease n=1 Tax=Myxacorys almedinensis A TaxID=2690445 RepID=A0A8J7Z107_9CYAN|nr:M48 family metalloprotease [Myxacorys almedinensis]NDJ18119.1 M48 family metalloprotease [Myxacorys almedinensis A]
MSAFPDPAFDASALEIGLNAIKQKNDQAAIAALEQYLASNVADGTPNAIKAQMGLVVVYARCDRQKDAIALCHRLGHSQNRKVQSWAAQMLNDLSPKTIDKTTDTETGFTPLDSVSPSPRRSFRLSSPSSPDLACPPSSSLSETGSVTEPPLVMPPDNFSPATADLNPSSSRRRSEHSLAASPSDPPASDWRNAGRAQRWQPLSKLNPARLQWAEMGTIAALLFLICGLFASLSAVQVFWLRFATKYLKWSAFIPSISAPFGWVALGLVGLFIASPWILEALLHTFYGMRSLSTFSLAQSSAEAHRLLSRVCQQQQIPLPNLRLLPTSAPLAFTYGCHPKLARIVVSQGLLDQLEDDEIAAIYAGELAHITNWSFSFLSLVAVAIGLPYMLYWQSARLSDWMHDRAIARRNTYPWIALPLTIAATTVAIASVLSYGIFRGLRWSGLWLSKERTRYSDRAACTLTGNPNGLARALLKSAIATHQTIRHEQKTNYWLEGLELLAPVGYRTALHVGNLWEQGSQRVPAPWSRASLLCWDQMNLDRHWLVLNNSHPLMGERLRQLMEYARLWQLEPEVELELASASIGKRGSAGKRRVWLQGAPLGGAAIGSAIALLLWLIAHATYRLGHQHLNWLATDYTLFFGFALMGFGIGTILRFNSFFPDLQRLQNQSISSSKPSSLLDLMALPDAVPTDSYFIQWEGTLLGRPGTGNWLGQDLMLHTAQGLIPLHYTAQLGAIAALFPQPTRPQDLVQQSVVITGWFRRGATPWVDVDTIQTSKGRKCRSGHQVGSAVLAAIATLLGILIIL